MPRSGWHRLVALGSLLLLVVSCQSPQARLQTLVAERLELAPLIAHAKWQQKLPVHDAKREEALLQQVRRLSPAYGLRADEVESFFQAQIAVSKEVQQRCMTRWAAGQSLPHSPAPDLQKDLRPRLDRLTQQLLQALSELKANSGR